MELRTAYKVLLEDTIGRRRGRWKYNIKIELECEDVDRIQPGLTKVQRLDFVNTIMDPQIP
jgi:hypothetical protein